MAAIRPVLLVGTGDFAELRAVLQAHGYGPMVAPSLVRARIMLRNFHVDAAIAFLHDPQELRELAKLRAPLVVVGSDAMAGWEVNCAAFVSDGLDVAAMPRILARVIGGERGIQETRGAA